MSIYASTLECSEKDPDTVDAFYNELESVMKNVKSRDNLAIASDFSPKTGTSALESNIYRKQIGIYRKVLKTLREINAPFILISDTICTIDSTLSKQNTYYKK